MTWPKFSAGLVVVLLIFAGMFVGIEVANHGTHRPEGTAERWLAAVSDTTRKGIRSDAVKRADKEGPEALGEPLTSTDARKDGRRSFTALEVGKATVDAGVARVPYLLHQYVASGKVPVRDGVVLLKAVPNGWRVVDLVPRRPAERVPSEGGKPPSSAPKSYWVIALLIGVGVTVLASGLVNLAGRAERAAVAGAAG